MSDTQVLSHDIHDKRAELSGPSEPPSSPTLIDEALRLRFAKPNQTQKELDVNEERTIATVIAGSFGAMLTEGAKVVRNHEDSSPGKFLRGLAISGGVEVAEQVAYDRLKDNHKLWADLIRPTATEAFLLGAVGSIGASDLKVRSTMIGAAWLTGRAINAGEVLYDKVTEK